MTTQDPKTEPQIEEKEEKEGPSLISNLVQMIILFWSLAVISFAYFGNSTRQIDTNFCCWTFGISNAKYGITGQKQ